MVRILVAFMPSAWCLCGIIMAVQWCPKLDERFFRQIDRSMSESLVKRRRSAIFYRTHRKAITDGAGFVRADIIKAAFFVAAHAELIEGNWVRRLGLFPPKAVPVSVLGMRSVNRVQHEVNGRRGSDNDKYYSWRKQTIGELNLLTFIFKEFSTKLRDTVMRCCYSQRLSSWSKMEPRNGWTRWR